MVANIMIPALEKAKAGGFCKFKASYVDLSQGRKGDVYERWTVRFRACFRSCL